MRAIVPHGPKRTPLIYLALGIAWLAYRVGPAAWPFDEEIIRRWPYLPISGLMLAVLVRALLTSIPHLH